jgi:UDP-hydrolysing UDP-N-acetyl-D-glucosamine 2-epimerase
VVTTSRADFGIYLPILRELSGRDGLTCRVLVSGSHLQQRHGMTVDEIVNAGFTPDVRIPIFDDTDSAAATARAIAKAVQGFGDYYSRADLDLVLVLGDRFEMFSAALATVPFRIPVAHLHGGEITEGAFDDNLRHALTKLAHIHFTSTEAYAARVRQLGEEPWRVVVCGAPALDNLKGFVPLNEREIQQAIGLRYRRQPLLVTLHAATLDECAAHDQAAMLLSALGTVDVPIVFTAPNADPGGNAIRAAIEAFITTRTDSVLVPSLGNDLYFSMMAHAAAMVGNSSSGIIEAASFKLPVLDIGRRQHGRIKPANVVTVPSTVDDIRQGLERVLSPQFRHGLSDLRSPYDAGGAAPIVADYLASIPLDHQLTAKKFVERTSVEA